MNVAKSNPHLVDDEDLKGVVETLHKEAGIDYDRPMLRNASPAVLYEEALKYEEGTAITSSGALATSSGAKTGRSPKDKRIVDDPSYSDDVWWGKFSWIVDTAHDLIISSLSSWSSKLLFMFLYWWWYEIFLWIIS